MPEIVDVIANGYEWICPYCGHFHRIIEYPKQQVVLCSKCNMQVELDYPEHAYE